MAASLSSRQEWVDYARDVESLGYATLVEGEHLAYGGPAALLALAVAADATTSLRVGTHVLNNDLRHPAMLAQEAATLDLLSDGRLDLGIGAGWLKDDYDALGLPFDRPGTRISRLEESLRLLKRLFQEESVSHSGEHYHVHGVTLDPKPVQSPHPPIFLGGGGKKMLSLAAREADIVSLDPVGTNGGTKDIASTTAEAMDEKVARVREAAHDRFGQLQLHNFVYRVVVTDDRRRAAEEVARWMADIPETFFSNTQLTVDQILESPYFLIGTVEQIVEDLQARRERFGISYITLFPGFPGMLNPMVPFSPVVARLAGTC